MAYAQVGACGANGAPVTSVVAKGLREGQSHAVLGVGLSYKV